ncbi:hypothetical protein EP7_003408 [Isosphaeraceae bacterium EP7]
MFRTRIRCLVLAAAAIGTNAGAQEPKATDPAARHADPTTTRRTAYRPNQERLHQPGIPTDPAHPDYYEPAHRSVIRHNPLNERYSYGGTQDDQAPGYRNPGGVGRNAEFYPAGDRFQNEGAKLKAAQFDQGPAATQRSAQIASYNAGTQRYNAIQGSINSYARPNFGIGFGGGVFYGVGR